MAPIRLRKSRRLHGQEPEYKHYEVPKFRVLRRFREPAAMTTQLHIRHPAVFSGTAGQEPSQWLKGFARVAKYNKWDDMMCLANVYFYLDGTAQQWFENNEEKLNSWEKFQTELKKAFGDKLHQVHQAEEQLKQHAQRPGETTQSYIQHVLALCKLVNPNMTEEDKVSHLMKGVAEDVYQALLMKDVSTTEDFIKCCQHIEAMHQKRVGRKKFDRLPNVVPMAVVDDHQDLAAMIRRIVREELEEILTYKNGQRREEAVAAIVQEEVHRALAPMSVTGESHVDNSDPPFRTYAAAARRQASSPATRRQPPPAVQTPRRRTDVYRTEDNTPVCFHCGRPGHVVRYCRERRRVFDDYYATRRQQPPPSQRRQETEDEYSRPRGRSPSPYPGRGRSPVRRSRSPSPYRGTSRSPSRRPQEN